MQEKQAIITLNYGYNENMWYKYMREIFIPSIKDYARRIQVDFILMNNNNNKYYNTWNQLQFLEYLDYYDRVMYIDGDCYIPKTFYYNYFNKVQQIKIAVSKDTFIKYPLPLQYLCNLSFIVMLLNNQNRYFYYSLPNIFEQKKYIKHNCFYNLSQINSLCHHNEECYINECTNKYNIKDKILFLNNILTCSFSRILTFSRNMNKQQNIYHLLLHTQIKQTDKYNSFINFFIREFKNF